MVKMCTEQHAVFCFISSYIYSYYITTFDASKKKTGAAQQPDVEAGQWIELNMLKFLCSVVSGKKGCVCHQESFWSCFIENQLEPDFVDSCCICVLWE